MSVCVSAGVGCGGCAREPDIIPHERFVQIYAEMLYLAEVHRGRPLEFVASRDSLYAAWAVDSTLMRRELDRISSDQQQLARLFEESILVLERKGRAIALRDTSAPAHDSAAAVLGPARPARRGHPSP